MKRLFWFIVLIGTTAYGQGVRYDNVAQNPRGGFISNATITLCTGTATGTPCSPTALGYTDLTTGVSCASGFPVVQQSGGGCTSTTDGNGNFGFWLIPGTYKYSISGPSVATPQTYTITVPVGATSSGGAATITGALTAGSVKSNGNVNIAGPEPWLDVTNMNTLTGCTNMVADGVTDNVPSLNCLITWSQTISRNVHIWYFPASAVSFYRFASKPNAISMEVVIRCTAAPVDWNPTGQASALLVADYTESTATNAFLDFTGQTSPGNSGVVGCLIWKNTGQTGGTAIKYEGTSTTQRAGGGPLEDVRISGLGTWNWGLRVDCTNITTPTSPGCRDISMRNVNIFQTTTGCASLNNAVHLNWQAGGCFATSTNSHVDVTGTSTANTQSINVEFTQVEILDTLALDWVGSASNQGFTCSGCTVTNLTATTNVVNAVFTGISLNAPVVTGSGQLAYFVNDPVNANQQSALVASVRAANWLGTGTMPATIAPGDIFATNSATSGNVKWGSDGNAFLRRNNGSGAGTNFLLTLDGLGTTPWQFDNANGESITKPFTSTLAAGNVAITANGFARTGNTVRVGSSGFTTANNTSLQTITGLTWNIPATALSWSFTCDLSWSQATANAAVAFGIQAATNAPTNIFANGTEQITVGPPATFVTGTLATLNTTTATAIVSGTPTATATNYTAHLAGTIENPASLNAINIMVSTAAGADAVTVLRGSACTFTP